MNKLVIFDLDGVLYETRDMHFDTLNAALMYAGHAPITREEHVKEYNGLPTVTKLTMCGIFADAAAAIRKDKQKRTEEWIRKNVRRDLRLVSLLKGLHDRQYKVAVVSNARRTTINLVLHELWLDGLVDYTVSTDEGLRAKPSPQMFFRAMALADSDPDHTIIVEDSPYGVEGAKASGATVVVVENPTQTPTAVMKAIGVEP